MKYGLKSLRMIAGQLGWNIMFKTTIIFSWLGKYKLYSVNGRRPGILIRMLRNDFEYIKVMSMVML
jgi:TM2 domain-containing membrane protein YozV